jgi:hypothetical protein
MKPESLVTIIIRLFAILVCLQSAFVAAAPSLISLVMTQPASVSAGLFQSGVSGNGMIGAPGILGFSLMITAVTFVFGVLLYIWSRPLGRLIAHGLE